MKQVYFDPQADPIPGGPFRAGLAALCDPTDPEGRPPEPRSVEISVNSYHSLIGFGIVSRLESLAPDTWAAIEGAESLLFPSVLEPAVALLYEADRDTYGRGDCRIRQGSA